MHDAITQFRAALALDPNYAKAWAGLALTYAILPEWSNDSLEQTRPLGRDAAEHAMALDRDLPEPYAVLGYIAGSEFRFATARAMYRRSIALSPSYATGHQWFGETLATEGDFDAALVMLRKAAVLDPKSAIVGSVLASVLVNAGHDEEGLAVCDSIVGIERDWCPLLHYDVAMSRKDYAGARVALEDSAAARGPEALRFFHAQMDALGGKGDAIAIGRQLLDLPDGQSNPDGLTPMSAYDSAFWYMAIGRNDLAIERFARYARLVPYGARNVAFDRHFATLHCEPQFNEILRSLKVEEPNLTAACPKGH